MLQIQVKQIEDLLPYVEAIESTYKIKFELLEFGIKNCLRVGAEEVFGIVSNGYCVLYTINDDILCKEGKQPFLMYDDSVDLGPVLRRMDLPDNIEVVDNGIPLAVVDFRERSVESWVSDIEIRNSYVRGAKYQQLEIINEDMSIAELDTVLVDMKNLFDLKREKFKLPHAEYEYGIKFVSVIENCHGLYKTIIRTKDGQYVATGLSVYNKDVSFGMFIDVTEDKELKNKYNGYVVGHVEMVRYAEKLECGVVNFGLYFNFKERMNFKKVWNSGLRFKSDTGEGYDENNNV